jgi:hypothetical protein
MTTMNEKRMLEATETEFYFRKIQIIDGVRVTCYLRKTNIA